MKKYPLSYRFWRFVFNFNHFIFHWDEISSFNNDAGYKVYICEKCTRLLK